LLGENTEEQFGLIFKISGTNRKQSSAEVAGVMCNMAGVVDIKLTFAPRALASLSRQSGIVCTQHPTAGAEGAERAEDEQEEEEGGVGAPEVGGSEEGSRAPP